MTPNNQLDQKTNSNIEYKKTFEDELDWKMYDQLHNVVLQTGGYCYEIKKFCVTTEFVALTLVAKFTKKLS